MATGSRAPSSVGTANHVCNRPKSNPSLLGHPVSKLSLGTLDKEAAFGEQRWESIHRRLESRAQDLDFLKDVDNLRLCLERFAVFNEGGALTERSRRESQTNP